MSEGWESDSVEPNRNEPEEPPPLATCYRHYGKQWDRFLGQDVTTIVHEYFCDVSGVIVIRPAPRLKEPDSRPRFLPPDFLHRLLKEWERPD